MWWYWESCRPYCLQLSPYHWHLSMAYIFLSQLIWSHFRSLQNSPWRYFCEFGILFDVISQRSLPPKSATHKPSDSRCQKQVIKCNAGSNSWDLASSSRWRIKRSLATHIKMMWGTGAWQLLGQKPDQDEKFWIQNPAPSPVPLNTPVFLRL